MSGHTSAAHFFHVGVKPMPILYRIPYSQRPLLVIAYIFIASSTRRMWRCDEKSDYIWRLTHHPLFIFMWCTTYIATVSVYDYPEPPRYPAAPGRSMVSTTMTMLII